MTDMIKTLRELGQRGDDRGVALPFVAIMLVLLIGMTAFAVDLGWLYLNGSRVQRGADAAALAGVVHLPANTAQVTAQSVNGANANGWDIGMVNGNPIAGGGPDSLTWQSLADNRLEVNVTATVPTFFLKVFGIDDLTMTRQGTAEYVKPVPIGSPFPCFGNAPGTPGCPDGNFWAAIQMPYTAKEHGDPYQSLCITANAAQPPGICTGGTNDDYRPDGYYYAVEVPSGATNLTVEVYDATFWRRPVGANNCPGFPETGDCDTLNATNRITFGSGAQNTHFQLRSPDSTPLDPTTNPPIPGCQIDVARNDASYLNQWQPVCTVPSPTAGIYVLRVWTSGNSGGSNQYSLRATATGGTPRIYGINQVSIFTNQSGTTMDMYLVEVDEVHSGKTLVLDLYDVGEDDAEAWMTFKMPNGAVPNCIWIAENDAGSQTASGSGSCVIQTSAPIGNSLHRRFNAEWLRIQIQIPSDYTCGSDCWWRVEVLNNLPHDRTTWAARVIGNPVRLVPNEP